MKLACPHCGARLQFADDSRRSRVRCPGCHEVFSSSDAAPTSPSPPEPSREAGWASIAAAAKRFVHAIVGGDQRIVSMVALGAMVAAMLVLFGWARPSGSERSRATLDYWVATKAIVDSQPSIGDRSQAVAYLRRSADELKALDQKNVDADVVEITHDCARLRRKFADHIETQGSWELFFEAFSRGFLGDLFGTVNEQNAAGAAILAEFDALRVDARRVRAAASQRYAVDFPIIE